MASSCSLVAQLMNLWERDADVRKFVFGTRLARIAAELMGVKGVRIYMTRPCASSQAAGRRRGMQTRCGLNKAGQLGAIRTCGHYSKCGSLAIILAGIAFSHPLCGGL